ncbi:MAG: glycosyltransferase family 4 protein [Moorea sp. SIO2I5]|nr:glycosyltransferase family 4 protein [Moorena sp. SIO2I5]
MAKLQIISTFSNKPYAASEALWHEFAHRAAEAGHTIEISLTGKASATQRTSKLREAGCLLKFRKAWPDSRLGYLSQKTWEKSFAGIALRSTLSPTADLCLINVGTLIEAAMEPYSSYLLNLKQPFSLIVHNNPEIRQYSRKILDKLRIILSKALRVYFVSERLWKNTEEQLLQQISGGEVVRNPVNLENIGPEPWPTENCLKLAIVGRWNAWVKGQVRALHALSNPRWKDRNWSLSLFGSGSDARLIQKAADFYGLSDRVHLVGFVDNIRKDIWNSHHLLLMPSMLEGMPLTLVEAMLCGRPAVVSDVGGARELVRDGFNGFLAGSPFANQIEDALERMWQAKEQLPELGQQAYKDAQAYKPLDAGKQFLDQLMLSLNI